MRLRKLLIALLAVFALAAPALAQKKLSKEDRAKLPRIAILDFKAAPDAWHGWRYGGWGAPKSRASVAFRSKTWIRNR